jgi:Sigma-70 region 2
MDSLAEIFSAYRPRLFGIAYRMLSSRADAEDILQETYVRWIESKPSELRSTEAWLITVVTRLCIDRLRSAKTEREAYTGAWLPEPLVPPGPLRIGLWSSPVISQSRFSPCWNVWLPKKEPPFSYTRCLTLTIPRSPR